MRGYLGLGLAVTGIAVVLFVWTRDGDGGGDREAPASDEPARSRPPEGAVPEPDSPQPARVMPRQRQVPRAEPRPTLPPAVEAQVEERLSEAARQPPPVAPASADENPELTNRVESAKDLFAQHDFEATAQASMQGLELYPESFWLRSLAVKSYCAMGEIERAKALIAEEPRLSKRKRLRVHCKIQVDLWN